MSREYTVTVKPRHFILENRGITHPPSTMPEQSQADTPGQKEGNVSLNIMDALIAYTHMGALV